MVPSWSLSEHKAVLDLYFGQRNQKSGFRAPPLFEAGIILALSERYRASGAFKEAKDGAGSSLGPGLEEGVSDDPAHSMS
jgi:hypothetical protein